MRKINSFKFFPTLLGASKLELVPTSLIVRTHPFPPFCWAKMPGISQPSAILGQNAWYLPVPQAVAQRRSWAVLHLLHGTELRGSGAGGRDECAAGEHHLPVLSETWKTWGNVWER